MPSGPGKRRSSKWGHQTWWCETRGAKDGTWEFDHTPDAHNNFVACFAARSNQSTTAKHLHVAWKESVAISNKRMLHDGKWYIHLRNHRPIITPRWSKERHVSFYIFALESWHQFSFSLSLVFFVFSFVHLPYGFSLRIFSVLHSFPLFHIRNPLTASCTCTYVWICM